MRKSKLIPATRPGLTTDFSGIYAFLSNFYACRIEFEGLVYFSVEAAYQAAKTLDVKRRADFTEMFAHQAKAAGKSICERADWQAVKVDIMRVLLEIKFRDETLCNSLDRTGSAQLVESNTHGDSFWGVCQDGSGKNMLGKLLMERRALNRKLILLSR